MNKLLLILLMAFSFLSSFRCEEEEEPPCEGENNVARLDIKVIPNLKEYAIGDTVWLTTSFDTDLELTNNQNSIAIDTAHGNAGIVVMKLMQGQSEISNGFDDFDIANSNGLLSHLPDNGWYKDYSGNITFDCSLDSCGFKVGFIPKVSGSYCLYLLNGTAYSNLGPMNCGLLNRFRENIFMVDNYNNDILNELGIIWKLEMVGADGTTGYFDVPGNHGAYIFKVH